MIGAMLREALNNGPPKSLDAPGEEQAIEVEFEVEKQEV